MKIENHKAILSYESHGNKVTVERPNSDITFSEFMEMVESVALAAGWSKGTIDEYFRGE